jgi:hypothetical protein
MAKKRKINKILPGDLIAYPEKLSSDNPVVFIISATWEDEDAQNVCFMILGEEFIYEGTACNKEYLLLSRI